jgi:hypothetical protein
MTARGNGGGTGSQVGLAVGSWLARPAVLHRTEGAVVLGLGVLLYGVTGGSWAVFALALLAPDLSALGFLLGRRVGVAAYNVFHAYPLPAGLAAFGLLWGSPYALGAAFVWFAHIGMDRVVGYGLKDFQDLDDAHPRLSPGLSGRSERRA